MSNFDTGEKEENRFPENIYQLKDITELNV